MFPIRCPPFALYCTVLHCTALYIPVLLSIALYCAEISCNEIHTHISYLLPTFCIVALLHCSTQYCTDLFGKISISMIGELKFIAAQNIFAWNSSLDIVCANICRVERPIVDAAYWGCLQLIQGLTSYLVFLLSSHTLNHTVIFFADFSKI